MSPFYHLLGVDNPFDPAYYYTTSWLLPPLFLALLRLLFSLYTFVTIFTIIGLNDAHEQLIKTRQSFSYFTDLTYWGLAFYFLFSALHTFAYARTGTTWLHSWPRPLQAAHALYYTTVVTFPILVTIVYWALLYKDPWFPIAQDGWSNPSRHALNSLYALVEIILPQTRPPPPLHLPLLVLILALYLALAYITYATEGFYPYSFLDPKKGSGRVTGYCFGILAAACIIFGVVWGLIWIRCWGTARLGLKAKAGPASRHGKEDVREMDSELAEFRMNDK